MKLRAPSLLLCLCLLVALLGAPSEGSSENDPAQGLAFFDDFSGEALTRWRKSTDESYVPAQVKIEDGGFILVKAAARYGYSVSLEEPLSIAAHDDGDADFAAAGEEEAGGILLQYEVELTAGLTCGGAYLKLLSSGASGAKAADLSPDTPYSIMFGPDRCGGTDKVHLIIRYAKPDGELEEKHLREPPRIKDDRMRHVYTLRLQSQNNSYEVLIDGAVAKAGSLLEDFEPPFLPSELMDDPEDEKPEGWGDDPEMTDPDDTKPEDWDEEAPPTIVDTAVTMPEGWLEDEPEMIPDPKAKAPRDWNEEEDGPWAPPLVPNPKCQNGCGEWVQPKKPNPDYKGKWYPAVIPNPDYKGPWIPRQIPNPAYFTDDNPLARVAPIGGVAVEVWTMHAGILFDNIALGDSGSAAAAAAEALRERLWRPVYDGQVAAESAVPLSERLWLLAAPVAMLSASWWTGFVRDLDIFISEPTIKHGVALVGAVSVPLWAIYGIVRMVQYTLWCCGRRRQPSSSSGHAADSDGEKPPELVPTAAQPTHSAAEVKKGDVPQPDDDAAPGGAANGSSKLQQDEGLDDDDEEEEEEVPLRQRRPRRA